jgi:hypothetical protein
MKTVQHTLVSRPIEMDDGEAVADILNAFFDDIGRSGHFTGDNVRGRLQTPTLNRETHTRLIVADGGQPFGYAFLWKDESGDADARLIWVVHPANRESNAGAMLLRWAEQQVLNDMQAATSTAHCKLQAESLSTLDGSQEHYHQFGYRVVRNNWVMKIEH